MGRSAEFDAVLRRHLPRLDDGEPLKGDVQLLDYGLDSMSTVTLLVELEEALSIEFPDELLVPETFETANGLWQNAQRLMAGGGLD
jgi:acyl carrier protein